MSRFISHCEYCGDALDGPVEKERGDFIVCGKRECQRAENEFLREIEEHGSREWSV